MAGKQLVFQSNRTGSNQIFIMNIDGSDLERLTKSPGYEGHPHSGFDGQCIVFNSVRIEYFITGAG